MAQMISHHSVIFLPAKREVWVSTSPYQLGKYLAYNLDSVFNTFPGSTTARQIYDSSLSIADDLFLFSKSYMQFTEYRTLRKQIKKSIRDESRLFREAEFIKKWIALNPNYFEGYMLAGDYFYGFGEFEKAEKFYKVALTREFENLVLRRIVRERVKELKKKG
jgi:tetratricopeptide (TPR) repeat protein